MESVLQKFSDQKYLAFNRRLVSSSYPMLGVRIPDIRKTAKEILKKGEEESFLSNPPVWHEEVILFGLILASKENILESFEQFLPCIDNWATCDTVILAFKGIKKHRKEFLKRFERLCEGSEFERRALIVSLLGHFLCDEFIDYVIELTVKTDNGEYYVSMAAAWLFATAMIDYPHKILALIEEKRLIKDTAKRTVRKAIESFRISPDLKQKLRRIDFDDYQKPLKIKCEF